MRAKLKQKTKARRMISLLLSAAMIVPYCGHVTTASAASENEKVVDLESARLEADKLPDSDCMYFGTASAEVLEQGTYAIRIYREGDLDKSASVEIHSVDMTALYGKDYEFVMDNVEVTEEDEDKRITLLEKSMTAAGSAQEEESFESAEQNSKVEKDIELPETAKKELLESARQVLLPLMGQTEAEEESAVNETREASGELAAKKQEQTGTESRKLTGEELPDTSIMDALMDSAVGDTMESLEYSASCKVEFVPYESEKIVTFRIIEDEESEGSEGFSLILTKPENAELYEVSTSAITILDDDEKVTSEVSFEKKEYTAKDGTVTVKLKRAGAEYSVCDVDVMSVEDTAKAGEDYDAVAQTISFAPYQTEQEIQIAAYGTGEFELKFVGSSGCSLGNIDRTTIKMEEKETETAYGGSKDASGKSGSSKKKLQNYLSTDSTVKKAANEKSIDITISDRKYSVKYNEGDITGKIMDESYVPAVEAGIYYFPLPTDKGGLWSYYGEGKTFNWDNHYYDEDKKYGLLEWYSWWTGHTGKAWMQTNSVIPGLYYQYFVPDWYSNNKALGGNKSRFRVGNAEEITVKGEFDRTQDMSSSKNTANGMVDFCITAEDDESDMTPKCYTYVYGVCAMYRRFTCSVGSSGDSLKYLYDGVNSTEYKPIEVSLTAGAENRTNNKLRDFYANLSDENTKMVFNLEYANVSGQIGKYGRLTGFKLKIDSGTTEESVSLNYPQDFITWLKSKKGTKNDILDFSDSALKNEVSKVSYEGYSELYGSDIDENGSADTVPYDGYFCQWISEMQKKVLDDGHGWYQNLVFTPVITYNDVDVEILPARGGGTGNFTNDRLKYTGTDSKTETFHQGDTLDMSAIATEDGYEVQGYEVSVNNGEWTTYRDNTKYMLKDNPLNGYRIRPLVVAKKNCIEIKFDKDAQEHIQIEGLIEADSSELNGTSYAGMNLLELQSGSDVEKMVTPAAGKVYVIRAYVKDAQVDEYGRVYKMESGEKQYYQIKFRKTSGGSVYTTNYFPMMAGKIPGDNSITVSYEKSTEAPKESKVSGHLLSACSPIIETGIATKTLPLLNYCVSVGANTQYQDKNGSWLPDTASGMTDEDGLYTLDNVYGKSGDIIPLLITDSVTTEKIVEIKLGSGGDLNLGNTMIDYPNNAPRVTNISFVYGKSANQSQYSSTENNINIVDDSFTVKAFVDSNGRNIKEAVFTLITSGKNADGSTFEERHEFHVSEDANNPGCYAYTFKKMPDELYNGDRLWIRLVDAEKQFSEGKVVDDEGNTLSGQYVAIEYPNVETGLVFSTEQVLRQPQTYELTADRNVDVPLLGTATGTAKTGLITFGRTDWGEDEFGQNKGYTLQVGVDGMFTTAATPKTEDKLKGYKNIQKCAREVAEGERDQNAEDVLVDMAENGPLALEDMYQSAEISLAEEKQKTKWVVDAEDLDNYSEAKDPVAAMQKDPTWNVQVAVVLVFDFVRNPSMGGEYTFVSGGVLIGGTYTYNKTTYSVIHGVPAFMNFTATAQANISVGYSTEEGQKALTAGDFDTWAGNLSERISNPVSKLELMFTGKSQVGVGMCGVLSARGYTSLKLQFDIPLANTSGGGLLGSSGGVGFDILIMSIDINVFSGTLGWGSKEDQTEFSFFGGLVSSKDILKQTSAKKTVSRKNDIVLKKLSNNEVMKQHMYSSGTSDMSTFGKESGRKKASLQAVSVNPLLDNAAEHTRPKLINLGGGKKMAVFIGSREDSLNSAALFYSVYNGKEWSMPEMVADDNTMDSTPDIIKVGDKVAIAWADAGRTFTDKDDGIGKLSQFGISAAVYDINSGKMGDEVKLTEDSYLNLSPQLNSDGTTIYCSYMKRDLSKAEKTEDLLNAEKVYSTMAYVSYDIAKGEAAGEKFIDIRHKTQNDPVVMDYNAVTTKAGSDSYLLSTYTIDEDTDLNTSEDKELYLGIYNITKDRTYYPMRITNDKTIQSSPKLTEVNGTVYLSWLEDGYIFHMADVSRIMDDMFDTSDSSWEITEEDVEGGETPVTVQVNINKQAFVDGYIKENSQNTDWYKLSAEKLGLKNKYYEDTIYEKLANGEFYSDSANLSQREDMTTNVSDYILTGDGEDVYLFFTDFGRDEQSTGKEIYGAKYTCAKEAAENGEATGFGKAVQITNADMVIDELDLYMEESGRVSALSNYFRQWIDDAGQIQYSDNQLVEIEFETVNSMEVEGGLMKLPATLEAGEEGEITFEVINNGLEPSKGYDYTVLQVKDGNETTIYEGHSDKALSSGESEHVSVWWEIPADVSDTCIKVVINETGVDNSRPYTASCEVPYGRKIGFTDTEVVWEDEKPYVSTIVKNTGNASSKEMKGVLRLLDNEYKEKKTYTDVTIPALKSGESKELKIGFSALPQDYDHQGILRLEINVPDEESGREISTNIQEVATSPTMVSLNDGAESITVKAGGTSKLKAAVGPWENLAGDAVFYSSDNSVASVDEKGVVTGVSNGTAEIGVYYPKAYISDTINVTVSGSVSSSKEVATAKLYSVKLNTNNQPVIKWKGLSSVAGYRIYRSVKKNSGFKKIAAVKTGKTSYTDKTAKSGKQYYYRIRAYKSSGGKNIYGSYSAVKGIKILKLTAPVIKAGKIKNGIVKITFKKYTGTNAVIYQKKNGKWKKLKISGTAALKKNKGVVKVKLKKGGTVMAKTWRKKNGKKYYSPASKSIKVKG